MVVFGGVALLVEVVPEEVPEVPGGVGVGVEAGVGCTFAGCEVLMEVFVVIPDAVTVKILELLVPLALVTIIG